jgi:hypothetical protein
MASYGFHPEALLKSANATNSWWALIAGGASAGRRSRKLGFGDYHMYVGEAKVAKSNKPPLTPPEYGSQASRC